MSEQEKEWPLIAYKNTVDLFERGREYIVYNWENKEGGKKGDNDKVKIIVNKMEEIKVSVSVVILLIIVAGHIAHLKIKAARLC